ncbi:MAG: hypothetical protein WDA59_07255 [Methanofastidiosum sp.]|jgi:hypothetical protein
MSRDHEGGVRGFHWLSKAWYGDANLNVIEEVIDEINLGWFHFNEEGGDDGTTGEFTMRWVRLGKDIIPKLVVFSDAFETLHSFQDVIDVLATYDDKDITPEQFANVLLELGFKDLTKTVSPYDR